MSELPTGTVTFLFTDVEGSTRTLEELGDRRYAEALDEHRRLIRASLAEHDGIEVDTQGDAFFCVFGSARAAASCAQDMQERLARTRIRVRMGLHTGEALVADGHYVGMDVHRGARVGACGHGGQVVLSTTTVAVLEPGSFVLRDLGEHRLKDLSGPQRLYQLGEGDFPPLKTLHRTNLPVPATPFLGRRSELKQVSVQVLDPASRLVTLTGPGGTGKTRLALQASAELADEFPGGVFWVPLAPLQHAGLVESAVAQALGVEEGGGDLVETIGAAIERATLVLLDNCEHVLDGVAAVVSPLVQSGRPLQVVATSREPLALAGERVVPVDPLARSDAIDLFRARAEAAGASDLDEEAVAALCARLDDLPLAVELAAARVPALPPRLLLERLSGRLDLLQGPRDVDERQRTLGATIRWSYDLLDPSEQQLLRRLSVFAGGGTLEAVEEVAEAELERLASLVAKSLLRATQTEDGPRYWMLETIREFGSELLAATDEAVLVRDRYAAWFARLAEEADAHVDEPDAAAWFGRLEADLPNLRLAFAAALEGEDAEASRLGGLLAELHLLRGRYAEAQETVARAIERERDPVAGSRLRRTLGRVLVRRGELDGARAAFAEAEELVGAPGPQTDEARWQAWLDVKIEQAHFHYWRADAAALEAATRELIALVEAHGTVEQQARLAHVQLQSRFRQERYVFSQETEELARASLPVFEAAGHWDGRFSLGFALLWRGKPDEALEQFAHGREQARAVGDVLTELRCLVYAALARRKLGDVEGVRGLDGQIAALEEAHGYHGLVAANRAWLAWRDGDPAATECWGAAATAEWESSGRSGPTVLQWTGRFPLLALETARDRLDAASAHARAMLDETQQPLPDDVEAALRAALEAGTAGTFAEAVAAARPAGYT